MEWVGNSHGRCPWTHSWNGGGSFFFLFFSLLHNFSLSISLSLSLSLSLAHTLSLFLRRSVLLFSGSSPRRIAVCRISHLTHSSHRGFSFLVQFFLYGLTWPLEKGCVIAARCVYLALLSFSGELGAGRPRRWKPRREEERVRSISAAKKNTFSCTNSELDATIISR